MGETCRVDEPASSKFELSQLRTGMSAVKGDECSEGNAYQKPNTVLTLRVPAAAARAAKSLPLLPSTPSRPVLSAWQDSRSVLGRHAQVPDRWRQETDKRKCDRVLHRQRHQSHALPPYLGPPTCRAAQHVGPGRQHLPERCAHQAAHPPSLKARQGAAQLRAPAAQRVVQRSEQRAQQGWVERAQVVGRQRQRGSCRRLLGRWGRW